MSDNQPIIHVLSTRFHYGNTSYRLLVDGRYYRANEWEYEMIRKGHQPEDLGMFEFRKEEELD